MSRLRTSPHLIPVVIALLLAVLAPAALYTPATSTPTTPVATPVASEPLLADYSDTREQKIAAMRDANVHIKISFDHHTRSHEVVTVDRRVIIGYEKTYQPNGATGGGFIVDRYKFFFAGDVELVGVFVRATSDAAVNWVEITMNRHSDGTYQLGAWRDFRPGENLDIYVAATDPSNRQPNPLPQNVRDTMFC
jgi:hypothetical protein